MKPRNAFSLAVLASVCMMAGGVLAAHLGAHSAACSLPQCNYAIKISSCDPKGVHPDYETIHVDKGTHRLHWIIVTPGYKFVANPGRGIAFSQPPNPPEFTQGTRVNDKEYSWVDTNNIAQGGAKKTFKYDIKIVNDAGKECPYDPYVVNE